MTSLQAQRAQAADAPRDRNRLSYGPPALREPALEPSMNLPHGTEATPSPDGRRNPGARLIDLERRARFGRFGFDFA